MLRAGMLREKPRGEGGGYEAPIPSFRTWLLEEYGGPESAGERALDAAPR